MQHHVELIQSLALKHADHEFKKEFPDLAELRRLSRLVSDQFWQKRSNDISLELSESQRKRRAFEESTRVGVQVLRNWEYPQHILEILTDLWKPLDAAYETAWGVTPTKLIKMFAMLTEHCENKLNKYNHPWNSVLRQKTAKSAIEVFKLNFPVAPDENLDLLATVGLSLNEVLAELYGRSVAWLSYWSHSCSKDEFVQAYGPDVEWSNLKKVLDLWTLEFGELATFKTDFLFMASPVREKPFIKLADDFYYLPLPNLLFSFADVLLEKLHKDNENLKLSFDKWKGPFVEEDLQRRLSKAFPRGEVFRGSKFFTDGVEYENDILVTVDNYAIIIEAKAAGVSESAKRAGNTVPYYVGELYTKPAEQALRFQKYLEENRGVLKFATDTKVVNTVDTTKIDHFIRLGVVFDDVSLVWKWEDLVEAGFLSSDVEAIPIIFLADFHVIRDLLERTIDKIHYLERRTWLVRNASYEGDELDLLVFYMETGMRFNFKNLQPDQIVRIEVTGRSQVLEPHHIRQFMKQDVVKKKPLMTQWMEKLLNRVETLKDPKWLEMGLLLLNIDHDKQEILSENIYKMRKIVAKKGGPDQKFLTFTNQWPDPEELFVVLVHQNVERGNLINSVSNFCQEELEASNAQRAVVLSFEPGQSDFAKTGTLLYAGKREPA